MDYQGSSVTIYIAFMECSEATTSESESGWTPAALFGASEQGAWYDFSDLSALFTDSAGTTAVTSSGDSIGRVNDKSGNDNHAIQATAGAKPQYNVDGSGNRRANFDGSDDGLVCASAITPDLPMTVVMAYLSASDATSTERLLVQSYYDSGDFMGIGVRQSTGYTWIEGRWDGVVSDFAASSSAAFNDGNPHVTHGKFTEGNTYVSTDEGTENSEANTWTTPNSGAESQSIVLGAGGTLAPNNTFSLYQVVIIDRALTTQERSDLMSYIAGKAGVTL